ncbi:MAG: hypothetical protein GF411_08755 [Candidatus Lokiarchaeota archaeon]|nr:hypothetical protein [Candidatus Lokiarchaeota archaeon]
MMIYYKQCLMVRVLEDKKEILTSWIPEKYAIRGKVIKLQNRESKEWTDGWEIILVGTRRREEKEVIERGQDYKKTRKSSDV